MCQTYLFPRHNTYLARKRHCFPQGLGGNSQASSSAWGSISANGSLGHQLSGQTSGQRPTVRFDTNPSARRGLPGSGDSDEVRCLLVVGIREGSVLHTADGRCECSANLSAGGPCTAVSTRCTFRGIRALGMCHVPPSGCVTSLSLVAHPLPLDWPMRLRCALACCLQWCALLSATSGAYRIRP